MHFRSASLQALFVLLTITLWISCKKHDFSRPLKDFEQVNLLSNSASYGAAHVDDSLINAWGLAFSPGGIAWVNAHDGHLSFILDKEGNSLRPPVNIPSHKSKTGGLPTGIVFNGTTDFKLNNGNPALFIFVGEDGLLSGWNPGVGAFAQEIKDHSATARYTGLAIGNSNGINYIYAADFKENKIKVWDGNFKAVAMPFIDPTIPSGYAPFNIQNVNGNLYVMYAKVGPEGDEEKGPGFGFVSVFGTDGSFMNRFASNGSLNAPWGVAWAPASFFVEDNNGSDSSNVSYAKTAHGDNGDRILVGNFGDGHINVYDLKGNFTGQLKMHGCPIVIEGLWALMFPPSTATNIDPGRLYFAAGPNDEKDGLFGYLIKK